MLVAGSAAAQPPGEAPPPPLSAGGPFTSTGRCITDGDPTTVDQQEQGLVNDPARPPTADHVNTEKLAVLSMPHPRSVAGIPHKYGFDRATSTFTVQYSSTRASGEGALPAESVTTIATPPGQYPHGYHVTARGAQVISAANAPVLAVAADPGATTIDVAVAPA